MANSQSRLVLDSEVIASCVEGSEDDIAKQVGSDAEQLGSEGKHEVVESVYDIAKQVWSRWKSGKWQGKRAS